MIDFIIAFLWMIALILSFIGWGYMIMNILNIKGNISYPFEMVIGISLLASIGGYLNLISLANSSVLILIVIIGIAIFLIKILNFKYYKLNFSKIRNYYFLNWKRTILTLLIIYLFLNVSLLPFYKVVYYVTDDYQAYFVLPVKMIQTGTILNEHFFVRQLESQLGSDSFLKSLGISIFNIKYIKVIDFTIGYFIIISFLHFITFNKNFKLYVLINALFLLILPGVKNVSSVIIPTALILLTLWMIVENKYFPKIQQQIIFVTLISSSIISLKTTYAGVGLLIIFLYLFKLGIYRKRNMRLLIDFFNSVALLVFFLGGWLLVSKINFDTYFYPFLGKGYHITSYYPEMFKYSNIDFHYVGTILIKYFSKIVPVLLLLILCYKYHYKKNNTNKFIYSLIAFIFILNYTYLIYSAEGYGFVLYAFSYFIPIILIFLYFVLTETLKRKTTFISSGLVLIIYIFCSFTFNEVDGRLFSFMNPLRMPYEIFIKKKLDPEVFTEKEKSDYLLMQNSVPEKSAILVTLTKPFLLDFQRNQIYNADFPILVSPPPGIPLNRTSEELSDYLIKNNVSYLAFSYKNEANKPRKFLEKVIAENKNTWLVSIFKIILIVQNFYKELYLTREIVFDDGENFVLDLKKKSKNKKQ